MFAFLQQQRHVFGARKGFSQLADIGDGTLNDIGTSRLAMLEQGHVPDTWSQTTPFDLTRALARSTGG